MGKPRSKESVQKRKLLNMHTRIPHTIYPIVRKGTKWECFNELQPQQEKGTRRYLDMCGTHLVIKLQNWFSEEEFQPLLSFMLDNDNCLGCPEENRRGLGCTAHVGCWMPRGGKFFDIARPTLETNGDTVRKLMKLAVPIAKKAGVAMRSLFPEMATNLECIPALFRPFDLWPLMVANFMAPHKAHKDYEDFAGGLCVAVPLGIFNGGELYFEDLQLTIPVHNGDLVLFRSDLLTHQVKSCEGLRMSLLFLSHHRFMRWIEKDHTQKEERSLDAMYQAVDTVVNWGTDLKQKKAMLKRCASSDDDTNPLEEIPLVSWPRVQGHNPSEQLGEGYANIEIPENVFSALEERLEAPKKKCKKTS